MTEPAATSEQIHAEPASDADVARSQTLFALLMLLGVAMVVLAAHFIVPHGEMLEARRVEECKRINGEYADSRFYASPEERLLYAELPAADYSAGGVYFLGTSQLQRSLMLWELPPEEQKRIHNYCLAASMNTREFQFLKYLVENQHLLKAGGNRNLVVLDLCFSASAHFPTPSSNILNPMWVNNFLKFGMYTYDSAAGIQPVVMPEVCRHARLERVRTQAFCSWSTKIMMRQDGGYLVGRSTPSSEYCRWWSDYFGPNWKDGMDQEIHQLAAMVDYLRARQVNFVAVYLPLGSWFNDFPPAVRFRSLVLPMLASKHATVVDMNHQLPDMDFTDSVHLSYTGCAKVNPVMIDLARQFLHRDPRLGEFIPSVNPTLPR